MQGFSGIFYQLVTKRLQQVYQFSIQAGPKIMLSAVILLMGWLCAVLFRKIISKILKALGFDVVSEKTGLKRFLEKGGVKKSPSSAVGWSFFWLIIFSTLIMVFNTLELAIATQLLRQTLYYIPKAVVSLILLALGIFLSRFVNRFVRTSSRLADIPGYNLTAKIAQYIVIGLTAVIILEYLGMTATIAVEYVIAVFVAVPSIILIIFLVGGRDIISSMVAGRFLAKEYKKGDTIEFDSISGRIESIDLIVTRIRNSSGETIIPNSELAKKMVKKIDRGRD